MNNFMTYDFNFVIPSDLSSQIILMIGRANEKQKRFDYGIKAMKYHKSSFYYYNFIPKKKT